MLLLAKGKTAEERYTAGKELQPVPEKHNRLI